MIESNFSIKNKQNIIIKIKYESKKKETKISYFFLFLKYYNNNLISLRLRFKKLLFKFIDYYNLNSNY